jgi:uncharacterized protein YegP (UPF0339 family)
MYYIYYLEASSNLWRWTLYNDVNRKLAQSVEKYYNKDEVIAAIDVIKSSGSVPVREQQS